MVNAGGTQTCAHPHVSRPFYRVRNQKKKKKCLERGLFYITGSKGSCHYENYACASIQYYFNICTEFQSNQTSGCGTISNRICQGHQKNHRCMDTFSTYLDRWTKQVQFTPSPHLLDGGLMSKAHREWVMYP